MVGMRIKSFKPVLMVTRKRKRTADKKKPGSKEPGESKQGGFTSGRRKESPMEAILFFGHGSEGEENVATQHLMI